MFLYEFSSLKSVENLLEVVHTDQFFFVNEALGLHHINFFIDSTLDKIVVDVELADQPVIGSDNFK